MKLRYLIAAAALLSLASCARDGSSALNEDAKIYFDAWISQNHPTAQRTALGSYIISQTEGAGVPAGDSLFARIDYSYYKLNGDLAGTTSERVARQCNTYSSSTYYGPYLAYRGTKLESMGAGLEEAVSLMKVGGKIKIVVPGWLSQAKRYSSEDGYLKNCSGTDYIYELELVDVFNDVERWERDSLLRYMAANHPTAVEDPEYEGFFYIKEKDGIEGVLYPALRFRLRKTSPGKVINVRCHGLSSVSGPCGAFWWVSHRESMSGESRLAFFEREFHRNRTRGQFRHYRLCIRHQQDAPWRSRDMFLRIQIRVFDGWLRKNYSLLFSSKFFHRDDGGPLVYV